MKTTLLAAALIALLISFAEGQDFSSVPQASLDPEAGPLSNFDRARHREPGPPHYCKPCLFYAGDFDPFASDANGLANELDVIVSTGATVYTPFIVPKGKIWTVTGLFTENLMSAGVLDPVRIPYEVRSGIPKAGGNGGKLVCHGRKPGTLIITHIFEFDVYATMVRNIKACKLSAGKYWMSVLPYCTNTNDSYCENSFRAFLANDDGARMHAFGPMEPAYDSFFNSKFFGANWEPSTDRQSSARFSVGVEGTAK